MRAWVGSPGWRVQGRWVSARSLRILGVVAPAPGVVLDVPAYVLELAIVSNDSLVVVPLPDGVSTHAPHPVHAAGRIGLESAYDLGERGQLRSIGRVRLNDHDPM